MLETPGAFIGEFDALDGPKVTYAFEYFDYGRVSKNSSTVHQLLCFVEGEVLLGKSVASGPLHHECKAYLDSVAAHVLTSNESREERVLYQESGCPCVGSFLFSIPDIVARGEKRRFCLLFLHPSYHELVARWDSLCSFVDVLLKGWTRSATARYQHEYDTLKNLEQLREESRRKPLRPLPQLLAEPCLDGADGGTATATLAAVFEDIHCFFEIVLPQALSQPLSLFSSGKETACQEAEAFLDERRPLAQSSIDRVTVNVAGFPTEDVQLPRFAKQLVLVDGEIVVKPLSVWLLQYLHDISTVSSSSVTRHSIHLLLRALFSGNQIFITGDDARDCAGFGMALSYVLPPSLVKLHVGSDRYRMPYESRILSLSQTALSRFVVAETPSYMESEGLSNVIKLFDMEAEGIVHVRVVDGRIHEMQDCDQLRRLAQKAYFSSRKADTTAAPPTTLESRIAALLNPYAMQTGRCIIGMTTLQLLTTQLHQLVSEYVVRGRVYVQLFSKQEVEANNASLSPSAALPEVFPTSASGSNVSSPLPGQRVFPSSSSRRQTHNESLHQNTSLSLSQTALRPGQPDYGRPSASSPASATPQPAHAVEGARITKHTHLSSVYGKQFENHHYVFSSFAPEDHAVLVFLGSA